jgi:hypothetical protein
MTIDSQLAEAGWLVQSREQMNRSAGLGVAVREFPTASGPVDYALFVGGTLCGGVEAKPEGTTLSGFTDQAARYMGGVPRHLVRREGQLRFEYVASGTEILFRDHADPAPRSRRVFFFHRPETLRRWLTDPMTIRKRLPSMPSLLTGRLRECQIDAVTNLEASLVTDHPRALIEFCFSPTAPIWSVRQDTSSRIFARPAPAGVSSGEVAFCRIKKTRECITSIALRGSSNRIHPPGTVLLAMIGEGKTRGQCAVLGIAACNNQNSAAIRVSSTPIAPEYIYHVLQERYYRSRKESQGGNQPALNGQKVASMVIPLPSLEEIGEVVRRLDYFSILAEAAEHECVEANSTQSKLRQSILKAAFEGRLVPQDPADEPAPALLVRLRSFGPGKGARRRRARAAADFSHPSLPGLSRQSVDPRVEPAGEQ